MMKSSEGVTDSANSAFGYRSVPAGQPIQFNPLHHKQLSGIFHVSLLEANPTIEAMKAAAVGSGIGIASGVGYSWWLGSSFGEGVRLIARQGAWMGAFGATAVGTAVFAAHLREKDDVWNAPLGAAVTGCLLGMKSGSPAKIFMHASVLYIGTLYLETLRRKSLWYAQALKGEHVSPASAYQYGRSDPYLSKIARLE